MLARPGVERLEDRELLASHFNATLNSGLLDVVAPGSSNQIAVQQTGQQIAIQGATIAVGKGSVASVPASQVSTIRIDAESGTDSVQLTGPFTGDIDNRTMSGRVDTQYRNGIAYLQKTWDVHGNLVKQITWDPLGTQVVTLYQNGKAVQQNTTDSKGNPIENVVCSASGEVDTQYRNGKAYQQNSFDAKGNLIKNVVWSASGEVDTLYQNNNAYQQNTLDASGNLIKKVTWGSSGEVDTMYQNGKATQQNTFDPTGKLLEIVTWMPPPRSIRCIRTARPISRTPRILPATSSRR